MINSFETGAKIKCEISKIVYEKSTASSDHHVCEIKCNSCQIYNILRE